ncbi:MAG: UDP-N-acetylmuramoyl-L-alanine--D-glutamate ligase [Patescibacteria group bacterium]|nr:UDP-N-acetylmuramoyl-L-alanine--D-glutamate ligase [Patescibacteria group bacterium]
MELNYKNKKVTIMGLGLQGSGTSAVAFFSKAGAKVTVTDIKTKEKLESSLEKLKQYKDIKYVLGQHRPEDFSKADLIIKGPGISGSSKYLDIARKNKVPIETEAGIFFELVESYVIGVTGTRGKSTTVQLIYEILKQVSKKTVIGGNIVNKPLLGLLNNDKKGVRMVLELSSFQLEGIEPHQKSPQISVITNFMADHLDRYKNLDAYHQAKETIIKYQTAGDYTVLNHDDDKVRMLATNLKSEVWFFSMNKLGGGRVVFASEGKIFIRRKKEGETEEIISLSKLKLIGKHRVANVLAAVAVASILKIPSKKIKKVLENFTGIEHRLEIIKELEGVLYINDTTATTPQAAFMALNSFKDPVILIAGGSDKGLDFEPFVSEIMARAKQLILLPGKGTDRILKHLKSISAPEGENTQTKLEPQMAKDLEEAVALAYQEAKSGDIVLLSPGCTSFGMFANEFERGDKFKALVENL